MTVLQILASGAGLEKPGLAGSEEGFWSLADSFAGTGRPFRSQPSGWWALGSCPCVCDLESWSP